MRCCLATKWRGRLCIYETVAVASDSSFERETKSSIRVQEKDRHLQFRLFDAVGLTHHTSSIRDLTVENPSGLVGKFRAYMLGDGSNDEGIAFSLRTMRGGDGVALQ
jgi:hypothetical protein